MTREIIHTAPGLVEVSWRPELKAVYLRWFSEYDTGTRVRDAVLAALAYVRANGVTNWVADVSTSPLGLSDADFAWVSGDEFRAAVLASGLGRFVLIPPGPGTGQDTAWVAQWEANTLSKFGDQVLARVCADEAAAQEFLLR